MLFIFVNTFNLIVFCRYLFDQGIEKRITILTSDERESMIYTSVGHAMIFQLTENRNYNPTFLLYYEGKVTNYKKFYECDSQHLKVRSHI